MTRNYKFTIDRSKWRCGGPEDSLQTCRSHGKGITLLLNKEGFLCCLGQIALQMGLAQKDIHDTSSPYKAWGCGDKLVPLLVTDGKSINSTFSARAMGINDDVDTTLTEKEQKLIALGKEYGCTIDFTGEYM